VTANASQSALAGSTNAFVALFSPLLLPLLSIAVAQTGNFTSGESGAQYSVTVSNNAAAGLTSGGVTVTESLPAGLTLVSMSGAGWTCPAVGTTCTRSDSLGASSSYPVITVKVNVGQNAASQLTNRVDVAGGGSPPSSATAPTTILNACAVVTAATTVAAVQELINEALGLAPAKHDLTGDGTVNVLDVQIVLQAALGAGCSTP
jgi:uncharacterized repeat protein (TIGR01451 family)